MRSELFFVNPQMEPTELVGTAKAGNLGWAQRRSSRRLSTKKSLLGHNAIFRFAYQGVRRYFQISLEIAMRARLD